MLLEHLELHVQRLFFGGLSEAVVVLGYPRQTQRWLLLHNLDVEILDAFHSLGLVERVTLCRLFKQHFKLGFLLGLFVLVAAHVVNTALSQLFDVVLKFDAHFAFDQIALLAAIGEDFVDFVDVDCQFESRLGAGLLSL